MAIDIQAQAAACQGCAAQQMSHRKPAPSSEQSAATFSLAEVAKHSTPSDCFVIVRGKVYDVTAWVPQHPGGALIYIQAGKDCTQLFDSYHPLYVRYQLYYANAAEDISTHCVGLNSAVACRSVLEKFYIGDVAAGEATPTTYQQPGAQERFYPVLRQRVEKYFRKNGVGDL